MRQSWIAIGLVTSALIVACSSTPSEPSVDEVVVKASRASRTELGISTWKAQAPSDDTAVVRGLDAAGKTLFETRTTRTRKADGTHIKQTVKFGSEQATATVDPIEYEGEPGHEITNHVAEASDELKRAVQLLDADLKAANDPSSAPSLIGTAAIHPQSSSGSPGTPQLTCGALERCNVPPMITCAGGVGGMIITCPVAALSTAKAFLVKLGFGNDDPQASVGAQFKPCQDITLDTVDGCDRTQSRPPGCNFVPGDSCPDTSAGAPDQQCSPACDAVHICTQVGNNPAVPHTAAGYGCLAI